MKPDQLATVVLDEFKAEPCYLQVEHPICESHADLKHFIKSQFKASQGWLAWQSATRFFILADKLEFPEQAGRLLNGECVNDDGDSLSFREDGHGGWIITRYSEYSEVPENQDVVLEHSIADDFSMLAKQKAGTKDQPKIIYRRYWKYLKDYGYHLFTARFVCFENGENLS